MTRSTKRIPNNGIENTASNNGTPLSGDDHRIGSVGNGVF